MRLEAWDDKAFWVLTYLSKTFRGLEYLAFQHNRYDVGKDRNGYGN